MELIKTETDVTLDAIQNPEQKETAQPATTQGATEAKPEVVVQPPTKFDGETDTQYNLRVQMFHVTQAKKDPDTTEEEKSLLNDKLKEIRVAMATQSNKTPASSNPVKVFDNEEEEKNAVENLKKLGFYTKEDIDKILEDKLAQVSVESKAVEQTEAIKNFYASRPDIAMDKLKKQEVEKWVMSNFNITPKSSKKDIELALDMTANYLFPRGQSSKAKDNEAKVDLVNITGTNSNSDTKSKIGDSTYKLLKETYGWSDEAIAKFGQ